MLPALINKALDMGYEITCGDLFRDPRVHGQYGEKIGYSATMSKHKLRLAIDLNLFQHGRYLTGTEDHRPLGEWWETVGGIWGGRFNDGNHYEWPNNEN